MKFSFFYKLYIRLYFYWKISWEIHLNTLNNIGIFKRKRAELPEDLSGKTVVITGANSGIGLVTAKIFAKLGATVWMLCRDVDKAKQVLNQIINELNGDKTKFDQLIIEQLDLSSMKSIRMCASRIRSETTQIDYLINNAGVMMCPEQRTQDGFELQFATNHLGHFLLTDLLMDRIKASPSARIINLSSIAHTTGQIHFTNINLDGIYTPNKAYYQSKLANIMFTVGLAERLQNIKNVTTFAVHPGLVDTSLWTRPGQSITARIMAFFHRLIFIDAETGAQTTLYCAFQQGLESGKYYANCQPERMLPHTIDKDDCNRLWEISTELCNIQNNNNNLV